jgi:aryl-alcohol dehydrogenase-like predicted oxidoreductase
MQKRRFGRSGHASSLAIFGGAAFWETSQAQADRTMELVIACGVNHIDVAPSYGQAEERIGPWMKRVRQDFFLGCKTTERTRRGAEAELQRSLKRLQVDHFDLYQIHAVTAMQELDAATGPGGALEAIQHAREQGLTRHIGITGHGVDSPAVFLEALRRFDFDSVLFPVNYIQYANPAYREKAEELLQLCSQKDVAVMAIKTITKGPWKQEQHSHTTWYEPFSDAARIQPAVDFALSQPGVTGLCTAGDVSVLPLVLEACEQYADMSPADQEALIASAAQFEPLFA